MTIRCLKHNCIFSLEGHPAGHPRECPMCLAEKLKETRDALDKARAEKATLVAAITIVRDALLAPQP